MDRSEQFLTFLTFAAVACTSAACAPGLISPQQAQDRMYDHLSRAEAHRLSHQWKLANIERDKARKYRRLIKEGKTTTPEQALSHAAWHRQRAETYQETGHTKFAGGELAHAARYEDFALRAGGIAAEAARRTATEHRARAAEYERMGLARFAAHYRRQAEKLDAWAASSFVGRGGDR